MNPYWAEFKQIGEHLFRYDTRVYLNAVDRCMSSDPRIGAIVAKNPGSARPSDKKVSGIQPIDIGKDKLIPVASSFLWQAYAIANKQPPTRGYVQVFNLFYLCNKNAKEAQKALAGLKTTNCPCERKEFPWLWYAWGDLGQKYPHLSKRFADVRAGERFYYDSRKGKLKYGHPGEDDFAKHTQLLRAEYVVPHLATLL